MTTQHPEAIQNLSPEQQEAFAAITLADARRRERLLDQVRPLRVGTPRAQFALPLLLLIFLLANVRQLEWIQPLVPLLMAMVVALVAQFQIGALDRRLDALVHLLEPQIRNAPASPNPPQPPPA